MNQKLAERLEELHKQHPDMGYRRLNDKLYHDDKIDVNDKRILRICRKKQIKSTLKHRYDGCTRPSRNPGFIAENVLNRDFHADNPNEKWVTDVTEFHVGQEKLYFSPLMDLANREIIAYNFATRPKFSLVKSMLEQRLSRIKPTECPIIHSDQGVLYGSAEWIKMLEGKAVQSMSRRGNCYDNAVIESFFAILKSECFYSRTYHSIAELQAEIEEYLVYYNQKRIKLGLKGLSPVQYRAQYLS